MNTLIPGNTSNKAALTVIIFFILIFVLLIPNREIYGQQDAELYTGLAKTQSRFDAKIRETLSEQVTLQNMKQEIRSRLSPETLAREFVNEYRRAGSVKSFDEVEQDLRSYLKNQATQGSGAIAGRFTVPTTYLRQNVTALAFDTYGYIAGVGTTNIYTLTYSIENLPAGEYYVLTVSRLYAYVDEMYDNVSAPVFSRQAWRDAKKVTVAEGTITENIDFELQPSAEFLCTLYRSDGITVASVDEATFTLTPFDRPEKLFEGLYEYNYTDGEFTFFVPFLGDFKLGVTPANEPTTWFVGNDNWNDADKLTISTFPGTVDSLDIILNSKSSGAERGSIRGLVTGNGEFKMIFAFKASDLSLANIAFIFYSSYEITDLEPGEYYVYAEDYLGNVSESGGMLGTFYKDAATLAQAQKVTVAAGQSASGINIVLRKGATIKGNITDQDGNPLAEMLIVAMNMNLPEASAFNLFTQMHVSVGMTDSSGNYRITGLAPGEYILRTLSDYTIKIFFGFPSLEDGPHKGQVVDEFYPQVYNLFDFGKAQRIAVEDTLTVANIDFALQKAKFFRGELYDAATGESINQALMVAFVDSSGFPFYNMPKVDYYGSYELGPFPSGKYRLLAAANHDHRDFYPAEYYEDARTFEDAKVLELVDDDLDNIDFGFDRAAVIQGHIDMAEGSHYEPAGEDTLSNFPVVLFNAPDGSFARNAYVQFDGGFRLPRVLPGTYKLVALPIESPFAATYYGGGNDFEDSESQIIAIEEGQVLDLNIELEKAKSVITGSVSSKTTGEPVANCLVIAYDETGHATGLGITDASFDEIVDVPATGKYQISGLRAGEYHLCTYAFTDESEIAIKVPQYLMAEDADLFDMAFGLLEALFSSDMNLYADSWYNEVPLRTEFNIPELVTSFLIYGMANEYDHARYPFYMPIPFQRTIPDAATSLSLGENTTLQDIDFKLAVDSMKDILVDVDAGQNNDRLPTDFILWPNYPNPFNSSTVISYSLDRSGEVELAVFNMLGQRVRVLYKGFRNPGTYRVNFEAEDLVTGVYVYQIKFGSEFQRRKLLLLK